MSERPNVFFLMTDQQRWDCIGRFNRYIKTPNLDKLAAQGIRFDQAVCQAPMCVPSRNSMMFGYYPSQIGVLTNGGGIWDESKIPSKPLPQLMQDAGYFTAGFGKTHWNHSGDPRGFMVRAEGQPRKSAQFEEHAVMMDDEDPEGLAAYFEETRDYGSGEENVNGYIGRTSQVPMEHHRDGFIAKKAMEFLNGDLPKDQPLFFYLSFIKPHAGYNVPAQFEQMYNLDEIPDIPAPPWEDQGDTHLSCMMRYSPSIAEGYRMRQEAWRKLPVEVRKRSTLRYFANCTWLDYYIGQAMHKARERGLLDHALIVYVSDHGEMMGERNHQFSKYCMYDSSVRVPMILSGSVVPPEKRGTVDDRPAELVDVLPTIFRACGIAADPRLPGYDLLSKPVRKGGFCQFVGGGTEPTMPMPQLMWRKKDVKLIVYQYGTVLDEGGEIRGELYDLKNDPNEWYNLYDDPAWEKVRYQMLAEMTMHYAAMLAKGPAFSDRWGDDKIVEKTE